MVLCNVGLIQKEQTYKYTVLSFNSAKGIVCEEVQDVLETLLKIASKMFNIEIDSNLNIHEMDMTQQNDPYSCGYYTMKYMELFCANIPKLIYEKKETNDMLSDLKKHYVCFYLSIDI